MDNTWFTQRSEADNSVAVVKNLIHHMEVPITHTTIENCIKKHPEYPAISLQTLIDVLTKWKIETAPIQINTEKLKNVRYPAITFLNEKFMDEIRGVYVMLFGINGEKKEISYIHPRSGWVIESYDDFAEKWSSVILMAAPHENAGEENYEQKKQQEEKLKTEHLRSQNTVRIIDNFLTPEECDYVVNFSTPLFNKSTVAGKEESELHLARTSYTAMLVVDDDIVFDKIYEKAAKLADLPVENVEYLQSISYSKGQQYMAHFDTVDEQSVAGEGEFEMAGQRKCTLLVYLNDDFEGGETYFPKLDIRVKPKKGTAVLFYNLDDQGKLNPESFHAGLPITSGNKYACNIWVRNVAIRKLTTT